MAWNSRRLAGAATICIALFGSVLMWTLRQQQPGLTELRPNPPAAAAPKPLLPDEPAAAAGSTVASSAPTPEAAHAAETRTLAAQATEQADADKKRRDQRAAGRPGLKEPVYVQTAPITVVSPEIIAPMDSG